VFRITGKTRQAINMGSYNYLGFAQNCGPIVDSVENIMNKYGVGVTTNRHEMGLNLNLYNNEIDLKIRHNCYT
jgi:serine palmitoyltransferase